MRSIISWLLEPRSRLAKIGGLAALLLLAIILIPLAIQLLSFLLDMSDPRGRDFLRWFGGSQADRAELVTVQRDACPGAPFILPADGFIGLLYADPRGPYSVGNPHQGIDIFSNTDPGVTPVYAAYDGYLTREEEWRSSLILRVPADPLEPERQVWLYYTHMADRQGNDFIEEAFPPGTREKFVEQGTLLGYTGDYNGRSARSVWVHLHFSIVLDDGRGRYQNELEFENTLDPSPYLGLSLNYQCADNATDCTTVSACG
jgi:peptidoglycan LD-endopeptidase LytH